ncbi:MAG: LVIVD repeat protein [Methanosaeta sp. PtaU1.Bin060]|nr:MAG: LVIVD repeat protein [Methanosaeta sp. PtaU1.Bin060]
MKYAEVMTRKWIISIAAFIAVTIAILTAVITNSSPAGYAFDVAASSDGYVFAVEGHKGMKVFKLDSNKPELDMVSVLHPPEGLYFRNIKLAGNYAFVASLSKGDDPLSRGELVMINISNPYKPEVSDISNDGAGFGLFIKDNYAYVAAGQEGLHIYEIREPPSVRIVGRCKTPGTAWDVWLSGNHAFIADNENGLAVVDVSSPASPKYLGQALWAERSYLFSMGLESGKYLINGTIVKEILNIFRQNDFILNDYDYIVKENDSYWAIMENRSKRISIEKDEEQLNVYLEDPCAEIARGEGDYVYVAAGPQGLIIVDVSNPLEPKVISRFKSGNNACVEGLAIRDNLLYLTNGNEEDSKDNGLLVIDVSNPSTPKLIGKCPLSGWVEGVTLFKDEAIVANTYAGVALIDISDVRNPVFLGRAS